MNRIGRTVLLTEMTADTSNGTCTHDILALVFGTALYEVHCLIWYKFNQMLRTCSHTFSAGLADLRIDFCNTIYDMDRIKRTCFHTISKSQTSIIAGLWWLPFGTNAIAAQSSTPVYS